MKYTPIDCINEPCDPESVCTSRPETTSHTFTALSPAGTAINRLSRLKATTGDRLIGFWLPLDRLRSSRPVAVSQSLSDSNVRSPANRAGYQVLSSRCIIGALYHHFQ